MIRRNQGLALLSKALTMLADTPASLMKCAADAAKYAAVPVEALTWEILVKAIASEDLNDPIQLEMGRALSRWDYADGGSWTAGTARNTKARRELMYKLLEFTESLREACDRRLPTKTIEDPSVVAVSHREWYPDDSIDTFYWREYSRYLQNANKWPQDNINVLDKSTTCVVERLACPWDKEAYQSKGLVVGYVQSGKTANFTGVVAKAVDSGYRLIIILAGMLDVLRGQTQRRVDKELIGKEILENSPGGNEYASDQEWDSFCSHGGMPSQFGAADWHRLTGPWHDYMSLGKGVDALDFEKDDPKRPLYERWNLRAARARLLVVKKNPKILRKVISDLGSLHRTSLAAVPALIIDDESDQASIDTSKLVKEEEKRRTATNIAIRELLEMLPRAQYVGYTATPAANVLVNPNDKKDIFPKDFIISLPRPDGYMGISDFFDVEDKEPDADFSASNEKAYVRPLVGEDSLPSNLQSSIAAFILSGAIKLYRGERDPSLLPGYKHHTMLVHCSPFRIVHKKNADFVREQYEEVTKDTDKMWGTLEKLFTDDFSKISAVRGNSFPFPKSFQDLRPHIVETLRRLEMGKLIRIVNGDNKDDTPDFDRQPIWSILVGGTKLSRGYTIEGLTVSYYRRTSSTADTLMQMGRWFGFRKGYYDLVRLFLGRKESLGKGKTATTIDLVEAFKAACLDEDELRSEIKKYAAIKGEHRVTPRDIPPLVSAHMLRPTAANKMRYSRVKFMNFGGEWSEKTLAPTNITDIRVNQNITRELLSASGLRRVSLNAVVGEKERAFPAFVGNSSTKEVLRFLKGYKWAGNTFGVIQREIDFISNSTGKANPGIDEWLLMLPQLITDAESTWPVKEHALTVKYRSRIGDNGRFKAFTEPDHKKLMGFLCDVEGGKSKNAATLALKKSRQAGILIYPVKGDKEKEVSIGFSIVFPNNNIGIKLRWTVEVDGVQTEAEV